ncbi:MAG: hypothetical protein JXA22_05720 [Candidatus Thermoplasmatota archaeon]|nr:hypothetical protein [Candidatus Thermoplasmatota archaeon]
MQKERVTTPFPRQGTTIPATLSILMLIMGLGLIMAPCSGTDTPEGFYSMEDIMGSYPSIIIKEGNEYHVIRNLDIPASKPLFLGPGTRVLFEEHVFLNMTCAPLFQGTVLEPVYLGPVRSGSIWGGINLMEADPSASPLIMNTTFEGAEIAVRSHSSDLRMFDTAILNSTRNGLDIKGPMGSGRSLVVERTHIENSTYYGIHLLKVEASHLEELTIAECGTGIRSYMSEVYLGGSRISDSRQIGINSVDSTIEGYGLELVSGTTGTSHQLLSLNSSISITNGLISGANVGISSLTKTTLELDGVLIEESYSDGIQALGAHLDIVNSDIIYSGESALHLVQTTLDVSDTSFNNNGGGTEDLVFSTVYSEGSSGRFEECTFTGSGYAHISAISSHFVVGNSTLGSIINYKMTLDEGSRIDMVDTLPPSEISFIDDGSSIRYVITMDVSVNEYPTLDPVAGAQIDLKNVDGTWMGSSHTGLDGTSADVSIMVFQRDISGVYSHLPITVIAMKDGYEVTSGDISDPTDSITLTLYPPNEGPHITLTGPVNGTKVSGSVLIEGDIEDDLGIYGVKFRFDEGAYRTYSIFDSLLGGHFRIEVSTGNISGGLHTIWVHAFDGTHISTPERRTIMVLDPRSNDTDEDGIPDIDEDKNGNGIVDTGETDPNDPDTDGDGLIDGIEIDMSDGNATDPLNPDTDGDFLKDGFEDQNANGRVDDTETDPNDPDTDGDEVNDMDDHFPLDPNRSRDDDASDDPIMVIIMATLLLMVLIIAVYLFIIKTRGRPSGESDRIRSSRTRSRKASNELNNDQKGPSARRR